MYIFKNKQWQQIGIAYFKLISGDRSPKIYIPMLAIFHANKEKRVYQK